MRRIVSLWLSHLATDRLRRLQVRSLPPPAAAAAADVPPPDMPLAEPVALATVAAGRGGLRLVAVDAAAHRAGLRPGLSLADARAVAPRLRAEPADPHSDRQELVRLADWCGRYTPWAAVDPEGSHPGASGGGGGLLLDVSGCAHLFGGEATMLDDLTGRIRGLGFTCRAAVAATAGAAWAFARFTSETTVHLANADLANADLANADLANALAPLPVSALRLAPETAAALHRLGLRRIGDLTGLPRGPLAARFGEPLLRRLDQALGRIDEPLSPRRPPPSFCARMAFAEPIGRHADVAHATAHLLVDLCGRLELAGRGARQLDLAAYRTDATVGRIAIGTSRPTRTVKLLQRLFREKLERLDPGFGIEVMTLAAFVTDPLPAAQAGLGTDDAATRTENLAQLVDRLSNRLGSRAVVRLVEHPSHLPERACQEVPASAGPPPFPPAAPARPGSLPRRSAAPTDADNQDHRSRQPRPPQLLASPEPITVIAPVPDGPPVLFRWRRARYLVAAAEGPERIGPEWWLRDDGHAPEQLARIRDYYRIEDTEGLRFWIFREGLYRPDRPPCWYLHGLFG